MEALVARQALRLKLPLLLAHLLVSILHRDGIVHQLLEAIKCMYQQMILDGCIQSQPELLLLLLIFGHICGGVTRQLDEFIPVLDH